MSKFKPEGISETIFKQRYALTDVETWEEACKRVAWQMATAESHDKIDKYYSTFKKMLERNLFCPGGRIWYSSGRPHPNLLNCFVLSKDLDSKEGWGKLANDMIITSMCGGGCVDADTEYFDGFRWKKISEYSGGVVAQYNKGIMELVTPNAYIKLPARELTRFSNNKGIDQCLCDEHAQKEVQDIAQQVEQIISAKFPEGYKAIKEARK
jgi:ribonucleotide reductase alpha subunit